MTFLQACQRIRFDDPGGRFATAFCADLARPRAPEGVVKEWSARQAYRSAVREWAKARGLSSQLLICWAAWEARRAP